MSFLTILTMISINVPGIVKYIQSAFLNFIYLDILLTDKWLTPLLFSEENINPVFDNQTGQLLESSDSSNFDSPLNTYFDQNGFSSKALIKNLGSTFLYLIGVFASLLSIPIFGYIGRTKLPVLLKWEKKLKEWMLWNGTIRFIL